MVSRGRTRGGLIPRFPALLSREIEPRLRFSWASIACNSATAHRVWIRGLAFRACVDARAKIESFAHLHTPLLRTGRKKRRGGGGGRGREKGGMERQRRAKEVDGRREEEFKWKRKAERERENALRELLPWGVKAASGFCISTRWYATEMYVPTA